jgi:Rrf2 family nitric oxide-sensitive transcriptional repressor
MRLTNFTCLGLLVLVHLARQPVGLWSIADIARTYHVSRNHLMKVVSFLAHEGFVETVRGRAGGIRLARPAATISLGDLFRRTERRSARSGHRSGSIQERPDEAIFAQAYLAMHNVLDSWTILDVAASGGKAD